MPSLIEDFSCGAEGRWQVLTDRVMGGLSTGAVSFAQDEGRPYARLTGRVSTANRGGFIQMRRSLAAPPPSGTTAILALMRGDAQRYFLHLRTADTRLPWQFYQAAFDAPAHWAEVRLPFSAFAPSGGALPVAPRPDCLLSVGVAAYGRDHDALVDLGGLWFI